MHDRYPLGSVLSILVPVGLALTVLWLAFGPLAQDAVFAALKLAVTR